MVMRRDLRSKGREFEPRHRILDGHFSTYICCKNCIDVCLKRPKINKKMPRFAHLKKLFQFSFITTTPLVEPHPNQPREVLQLKCTTLMLYKHTRLTK